MSRWYKYITAAGLALFLFSSVCLAHNPLSARYDLVVGEQTGLLTISLSQDGVNQTLLQAHDRLELEALPQKEFKELIVEYVKQNFKLTFNGQDIALGQGAIKLGDHQTDLKFVLPSVEETIAEIAVEIPAFRENEGHQTIFSYQVAGRAEHIILNSDNDFRASLDFRTATPGVNLSWIILAGIMALGLVAFFMVKRNELGVSVR